jgi:hypothetical protein
VARRKDLQCFPASVTGSNNWKPNSPHRRAQMMTFPIQNHERRRPARHSRHGGLPVIGSAGKMSRLLRVSKGSRLLSAEFSPGERIKAHLTVRKSLLEQALRHEIVLRRTLKIGRRLRRNQSGQGNALRSVSAIAAP